MLPGTVSEDGSWYYINNTLETEKIVNSYFTEESQDKLAKK